MKKISGLNYILWDFDGVILRSNGIRDMGFELVLKDFPRDQVEALLDFHRNNGGWSRYVKFRYFFEEVRGEAITDEAVNFWARKFSEIMLARLTDTSLLIAETVEFINRYSQSVQMHVVSGSDQTELRQLCKSLGIDQHFKTINGSPTPKRTLVETIITYEQADKAEVVLIGDSINDLDAADHNGIRFWGYNQEALRGKGERYIDTFKEIKLNR